MVHHVDIGAVRTGVAEINLVGRRDTRVNGGRDGATVEANHDVRCEDEMVAQAACVLMHRQRGRSHEMSVIEAVDDLRGIADATGVDDVDLAHLIVRASDHRARGG